MERQVLETLLSSPSFWHTKSNVSFRGVQETQPNLYILFWPLLTRLVRSENQPTQIRVAPKITPNPTQPIPTHEHLFSFCNFAILSIPADWRVIE